MLGLIIGPADYEEENKQVATKAFCAYHIFLFEWKLCEHIYIMRNTKTEVFKLY
jgi:hypothetical protein